MNDTKTTKPLNFQMDLADAVRVAQGMIAAVSPDDVTPIITQSHWTLESGVLTAFATDRYRVHRMKVPVPTKTIGKFLMPTPMLKWLVRHRTFYKQPDWSNPDERLKVRLKVVPQAYPDKILPAALATFLPRFIITARIENSTAEAISLTTPSYAGSFPPVAKLIDEAIAAPALAVETISLQPEFMVGTRALAGASRAAPLIKFTEGSRPDKPGPVLITYGDDAEALIQPNLITR